MTNSVEGRLAEPITADERQAVDLELLRELFDRTPLAMFGMPLAALATVFVLRDAVSGMPLMAWLGCVLLVGVVRYAHFRQYRRATLTAETAPGWRRRFTALTAVLGIVWGAAGVFVLPDAVDHQPFVMLVTAMLTALAVIRLSVAPSALVAFALPATLPFVFRFVTAEPLDTTTGTLCVLIVALAGLVASRANALTRSEVGLRVRLRSLVSTLATENTRVDDLNHKLTAEAARRRSVEEELQQHRERLEAMVEARTTDLTATNRTLQQEVAERMQVARRLQAAESKYRVLVEQSLEGVCVIRHGRFAYVNPGMTETCGYSQDELLALPSAYDAVVPDDREMVAARVRRALAHPGVRLSAAFRVRRRDGAIVDLEVRGSRIDYEGEAAVIASVRDDTQRKRLQARALEVQTLESAGRLAGGVAHTFNNALTTIFGRCRQLLTQLDRPDDPRRAAVEAILSVAERSARVTRQLLVFGRRHELQPELFDPSLTVRRLDQVARSLVADHIQMELRIEPDVGMVWADPAQIEQAIMNLVLNASDAMTVAGTLTIEVANSELDQAFAWHHPRITAGPHVRISVSDSGVGMNDDTKRRVFEPFFTTKEHTRATGLGLTTTRGVVRQSGGDMSVDSEPDRGSTFTVYLPRVEGVSVAPDREPDRETTRAKPGSETILCVEDEPDVRAVVCEMLQDLGYTVIEASDGPSAVRKAEDHTGPIDLLLTDIVMPGMSGYGVAAQLRRSRPGLPVLYMTGYPSTNVDRPAATPDAPMLQKPFEPHQLAERVRDILDTVSESGQGVPVTKRTSDHEAG